MKNHACPFAVHCPRYTDDCCQGCPNASCIRTSSDERHLSRLFAQGIWDSLARRSRVNVYPASGALVPEIERVIFNKPATIVFWADGSKTVVQCQEAENWSEYVGLSMAISKKALGNKGNFNDVFKKWVPNYGN